MEYGDVDVVNATILEVFPGEVRACGYLRL